MALDVDFTSGIGSNEPWGISPMVVLRRQVVDLDVAAESGTLTSTDRYAAIDIPAGTLVLSAWFEVTTADGAGGGTVSLGDTAAVDTWFTAAAIASTGIKTTASKYPKLYTSADVIDLQVAGVAIAHDAVIVVSALCIDCNV
jgi:hypothetical protein